MLNSTAAQRHAGRPSTKVPLVDHERLEREITATLCLIGQAASHLKTASHPH